MDIQQQPPYLLCGTSPRLRLVISSSLLAAGVLAAGVFCGIGNYRGAAVAAAASIAAGFLVFAPISLEAVLITWFASSPLASFYFRFPVERSIITYDRVVFGAAIVLLLFKWKQSSSKASTSDQHTGISVSKFEVAWSLMSVVALGSAVALSNNFASAMRTAVDTFWLPLIAFHIARNWFDARRSGRLLVLCGTGLTFFLFASGALEFVTGADLFAYKGSEIEREGERRVNGPFLADSSYAIICLILFLFLRAAPRIFRLRFDRTAKIIHAFALAAAALGALLPFFRAVAVALVGCWAALEWLTKNRGQERRRRSSSLSGLPGGIAVSSIIAVAVLAFAVWAGTLAPSTLDRLSDPRSMFGRLATWKAAAEIGFENQPFGVGLGNYPEHFEEKRYYADEPLEVAETRASNTPHSNVLWIGAELGVTGVTLYIVANLYLFFMGWRGLKRWREPGKTAAACFLVLLAAYWIPGITLTSAGYSDLNLYFFFLLGMLSNLFSPVKTEEHE